MNSVFIEPQYYHVIIGTKAQLVKMAPVMLELDRQKVSYKFVLTGQHKETMSDLISSFSLQQPDLILFDVHESDTPTKLLSWLMSCTSNAWRLRASLKKSKGFIVHGDTLSTLWGALFARALKVKVIHIEAGLRSYNYFNPFPEEIIRVIVTRLAHVLFAGGLWAKGNIKENSRQLIVNTKFNTIMDSLRFAIKQNNNEELIAEKASGFIVVSVHRAENILSGKQFDVIMRYIISATKKTNVKLVLHPITRKKIKDSGWQKELVAHGVELIPRMTYVKFMQLLSDSNGLLTDGGSNQEEAALIGLPCLLLRKHTERTEGLDSNVILSKLDNNIIEHFLNDVTEVKWTHKKLPDVSPSEIIATTLNEY